MPRFANRVIVVTGGGTGIGLQIAKDIYDEEGKVYILGRREEKLLMAQSLIGGRVSERIAYRVCDVGKEEAVERTFRDIQEKSGNIYGLVNNAGVPSRHVLTETTSSEWDRTLETNLKGPFLCSRYALAQMVQAGEGSIVNISSVGGLDAFRRRTAYNASKAGLVSLTQSTARDYAAHGIRANAVCPGYVRTDMTGPWFDKLQKENPEEYKRIIEAHAMKRLGRPEEIARAVTFLLSDEASFITGVALPVDGGYLCEHGS